MNESDFRFKDTRKLDAAVRRCLKNKYFKQYAVSCLKRDWFSDKIALCMIVREELARMK